MNNFKWNRCLWFFCFELICQLWLRNHQKIAKGEAKPPNISHATTGAGLFTYIYRSHYMLQYT